MSILSWTTAMMDILLPSLPFCSLTTESNDTSSATCRSSTTETSFRISRSNKSAITVFFGSGCIVFVTAVVLLVLWIQRRRTYNKLVRCGLPTVYWHPKFIWYNAAIPNDGTMEAVDKKGRTSSSRKLSSSTITNILPRMKRLHGPYGMYGTVYGINTPVVHIAHPIPAITVLSSLSSSKAPAYNHFKEFCGEGTFTADGTDWKNKRSAVLHALMRCSDRSCTNINGHTQNSSLSSFYDRVANEANHAANQFISSIDAMLCAQQPLHDDITTNNKIGNNSVVVKDVNIVPLLQRATIGLIYRYITHRDLCDDTNRATTTTTTAQQCKNDSKDSSCCSINKSSLIRESNSNDNIVVHCDDCSTDNSMNSSIEDDDIFLNSCSDDQYSPQGEQQQQKGQNRDDINSGVNMNHHIMKTCDNIESNTAVNTIDGTLPPQRRLIQEYLCSITRIRMIILAQSRSIWFLLPRWCYHWFSSLYRSEQATMRPIYDLAEQACCDAIPGSPLHTLRQQPLYRVASKSDKIKKTLQESTYYSSEFVNPTNSNNSTNDSNNEGKNSRNLVYEAITLLFAGQDTSAATLSWTLHLLTLYPKKQERLWEEVESVMGTNRNDPLLTKSQLSKLVYLDAVVKESMRLYPVAPFVVRKLNQERAIGQKTSNDATVLPNGVVACIWIYSLHRNPQFWSAPDRFRPERWLMMKSTDTNFSSDSISQDIGITTPGAYIPFASGPRSCVGQPLANIIVRTVLARLIHRYKFDDERIKKDLVCRTSVVISTKETIDDVDTSDYLMAVQYQKEMQAGFTVLPQDGVQISICRR